MKKRAFPTRIVLVAVVAAAIAGGAYAFTASNTVPTSNAGAGAATVSGYVVSNIHYVLDSTTPTNIDSLSFTVSPAIPSAGGGTVVAQAALSSGGPNNYTCTPNTAGTTITCPTTSPQLTAALLTGVTIVAAQ